MERSFGFAGNRSSSEEGLLSFAVQGLIFRNNQAVRIDFRRYAR